MKRFGLSFAALMLALAATPAAAQSFDNTAQAGPNEVRVQAGIVIPLGGGGTDAERAPRLEAWSDHRTQRPLPQASLRPDLDPPKPRPMRIGVNFSGSPRMLVNGREAPGQTDRKNISGLGIAGIVVAVVVVAAAVFVIEYKTSGLGD